MVLLVRAGPGALGLGPALRGEVMAVDRNVPVSGVTLVEKDRHGLHAQDRFNTFFLGAFAITGLLLASLGVYGTVAYTVSRRTHEIGVRMALGARRSDIMRAVLRQGLQLTLAGLAIGLVGALAATRIIRSLLYEVSPTDPLTFVCVAVLLSSVTLLASYVPARRAAKVDPMVALRYE